MERTNQKPSFDSGFSFFFQVENPGVTSRYQYKEWDIPAHENGWRDSFSCFGLQWEEKTEEHAYPKGTGYVGVGGISMWEEI